MNLVKIAEVHDGCVNTIVWNDQGRLILSGSDDLLLKITDPFQPKVITTIRSGHRSNIFKARFLPFSDDSKIVSCSGDGHLMYTEVHRPETHGTFRFTCHQGSTATVETIHNDPFSFLSCGEDGTVRHFDIRTETSYRKRNLNHAVIYKSCGSVSAMAVNQLAPHQLAVCCTDGVVRLLDRRYLYGGSLSQPGTGARSNRDLKGSFLRFSPLKSSHECEEDEEGGRSFGGVRRRITSVAFCPSGGHEVLVSYSGDSLYLFGLDGKQRDFPLAPIQGTNSRRGEGVKQSSYTVPDKVLKTDQKSPQQQQQASASTGGTSVESNSSANRKSFFQRLRIRGDWSDTGPSARPLGVTPRSAAESSSASETTNSNSTANESQQPATENRAEQSEEQPVTVNSPHETISPEVPQGTPATASTSASGRGQPPPQLVRRGRQATLARFSSLLNQMLVEQFENAAAAAVANDDTTQASNNEAPDRNDEVNAGDVSIDNTDGIQDTLSLPATNEAPPVITSDGTETESVVRSPSEDAAAAAATSNEQVMQTENNEMTLDDESTPAEVHDSNPVHRSEITDQTGTTEAETGMEVDNDVTISYEEQRRAYVREVREQVANAPLIDEVSEDAEGGSASDGRRRGDSHSNTLVFVRQTSSGIPSSPTQSSNVMVFISPSSSSQNPATLNETSNLLPSQIDSAANVPHQMLQNHSPPDPEIRTASNEDRNSTVEPTPNVDNDSSDGVPQGSANLSTGIPQGSQESQSGATRSAEQRWASVADDLIGMIRSRNRASNSRSAAAALANRRNRLELQLPQPRLRFDADTEADRTRTPRLPSDDEDDEDRDSEGEEQEKKDAEILGLLRLKNAAVRMKFSGHRNTRTMIKQANFWGDDYVITGSDCGHVFFYERHSGKLVTILEADSHVVNCVQPHPSKCILASSGIDYNVKLWMPTGPPGLGAPGHMLELVERNVVMQRQTRDLITVPASFMLRLLAMATPAANRASSTNSRENTSEGETENNNNTEGVQEESAEGVADSSSEDDRASDLDDNDDSSYSVHSDDNL